jgi:hypothetical protein
MKLGEIIKSNNWLSVELTLLNLYPDQEKNLAAYRSIYEDLQHMEPDESEIEIVIEQDYDEESEEYGVGNVYGIDHASTNDVNNGVALEFTKWNKWLGMRIHELTTTTFTELEIIAHCLYEMTFMGYEEDEIQEEFERIKGIAEEYKNLSPEEKKSRTKSLDDLLEELYEEE